MRRRRSGEEAVSRCTTVPRLEPTAGALGPRPLPGARLPLAMACRSPDLLRLRDGDADPRLVRAGRDRLGAAADAVRGTAVRGHTDRADVRRGRRQDRPSQPALCHARRLCGARRDPDGRRVRRRVDAAARVHHRRAERLVRPSDLGVRIALVADNIPRDQLVAAMGISRTTSDCARVVGALAGAGLFAAFGMGPAYVAVASFYALGLLLHARPLRQPLPAARGRCRRSRLPVRPSAWRDLSEGSPTCGRSRSCWPPCCSPSSST